MARKSVGINSPAEPTSKRIAELTMSPIVAGAAVSISFGAQFGEQSIDDLCAELLRQTKEIRQEDLTNVEAMLYSQAIALQTMFVSLARRAQAQEHLKQFQTHMSLALKVQAQCRATLETLVEVKYPKGPTFVRQQNVAYQQQVNNGTVTGDSVAGTHLPAHARGKFQNQSNELLEAQHGKRLDSGAASTASGNDSDMAAVDRINRSENGSWESA